LSKRVRARGHPGRHARRLRVAVQSWHTIGRLHLTRFPTGAHSSCIIGPWEDPLILLSCWSATRAPQQIFQLQVTREENTNDPTAVPLDEARYEEAVRKAVAANLDFETQLERLTLMELDDPFTRTVVVRESLL
jgi:hypothetical protein